MTAASSAAWADFPRNVVRAALLDVDFFNRAEQDPSLNAQASLTVVLATGFAGAGSAAVADTNIFIGIVAGVLTGIAGWLIWALAANEVGTRLFAGSSDFGQMRRVIGFACGPLAIGAVPWLGFPGAVWVLVAAVIAIREGMDFSTGRAVATMAFGWAVWLAVSIGVNVVLGVGLHSSWPF